MEILRNLNTGAERTELRHKVKEQTKAKLNRDMYKNWNR